MLDGVAILLRSRQPLAAAAGDWCRDAGFPADRGTLLRQIDDPYSWMALVGDAGMAIVAVTGRETGVPGERRSSVYVVTPAFVRAAALFDGSPPMMGAFQAAAPVLGGRSDGLFEIGPASGGQQR